MAFLHWGSVIVILCWVQPVRGLTIRIGVLLTNSPDKFDANSFQGVASAISIALESYQERTGRLTEHTFQMVIQHRNVPSFFGKMFALCLSDERPDVMFGITSSNEMSTLGLYLSNWKIPMFSHGAIQGRLTDKDTYSTFIRLRATAQKTAKGVMRIFRYYGWKRAALVTSDGCSIANVAVLSALKNDGVTITEWIVTPREEYEDEIIEGYLDRVRERARILVVCFHQDKGLVRFMKVAKRMGLTAPDYVFLDFHFRAIYEYTLKPWVLYDYYSEEEIEEFKQIFIDTNFKRLRMPLLQGKLYDDFYDYIPVRLSQPPWNNNRSLKMGWKGEYSAVMIHDAALIYFNVLDELISEGRDWRDGELVFSRVRNRGFTNSLHGRLFMDENADREPDYWILDFHQGWNSFREVTLLQAVAPEGKEFLPILNQTIHWGTVDNAPPLDQPVCGFQNELCPVEAGNLFLIIGLAVGGIIVLSLVMLVIILYRQHKEEEALQQTVWKVDFSEIKVGKARAGSVAQISQRSLKSDGTGDEGDEARGTRQFFTEVGTYRGNLVAILRVQKSHVILTRANMKELKLMKDLRHSNLAQFVGACVEAPNISYIMAYYNKGSLQDIIENDVIGLDWMFKTSLLSDLSKGMAYLHKSDLQSHGNLKSTCCLVDSRWQLKVSSYGLHYLKEGQSKNNIGEYEEYWKMLWTAPELLRLSKMERPCYGTQAGDVYSFAVISQEVIYRAPAYFLEGESPKDLVSKLVRSSTVPYRPLLPKVDGDTPPEAVDLVTACWDEDPAKRPSFEKIEKMIRTINKGENSDIMANLIQKLEKYANGLEDIVNQRTSELLVEKKKTDKLLESMLPASIVQKLKHGETVVAEIFEAVTIFFSDIVGFTTLSLESSAIDIVHLLNNLYSTFDDIISVHDVYKVETISDSYMVVSGLPIRNGDNHVAEIATLALDLMSASITFKIGHRPGQKLMLRIGFHTGPCAAGVVGLSMPRYCLFGDTVNMSSRMETNGKALMIQMSKHAFEALNKFGQYEIKPRGDIQIKGKGLQMTYWLLGKDGYDKDLPLFDDSNG